MLALGFLSTKATAYFFLIVPVECRESQGFRWPQSNLLFVSCFVLKEGLLPCLSEQHVGAPRGCGQEGRSHHWLPSLHWACDQRDRGGLGLTAHTIGSSNAGTQGRGAGGAGSTQRGHVSVQRNSAAQPLCLLHQLYPCLEPSFLKDPASDFPLADSFPPMI